MIGDDKKLKTRGTMLRAKSYGIEVLLCGYVGRGKDPAFGAEGPLHGQSDAVVMIQHAQRRLNDFLAIPVGIFCVWILPQRFSVGFAQATLDFSRLIVHWFVP